MALQALSQSTGELSVKADGFPSDNPEALQALLRQGTSMLALAQFRRYKIWLICALALFFPLCWLYLSPKWDTLPRWRYQKPHVPPSGKGTTASPSGYTTVSSTSSRKTNIAPTSTVATTIIPTPSNTYTQTLVIAKLKAENATWAEEIAQELPHLTSAIYTVDDHNASLTVPMNKGHEAMVYLTYIIEHYSELSDVTIFMHSHQYTWHNNDFLNSDSTLMVKRLKSEHVIKNGYMNLRCHLEPGCPDHIHPTAPNEPEDIRNIPEAAVVGVSWTQLFPNETVPEVLSQPCCSQFAVSSEKIRNVSLDEYISYRDWLLDTELADNLSGRIWEYVWQWLFTGESEFCPEEASCYCEGYGICFDQGDYEDYFKFRKGVWELEKEIDKLKESANGTLDIPEDRISSMMLDVQDLRQKMDEIKEKAV